MSLSLTLLLAVEILGFYSLLAGLRQAPEGREDRNGFTILEQGWRRIATQSPFGLS